MSNEQKGSYTYPDVPGDPERSGVLRNKLNLRTRSDLTTAEYALTTSRMAEVVQGREAKDILSSAFDQVETCF
ncbi:hypothetical protein [uncultured Roseibium sp.]|uniref:hypothetical protein n=1 Tax=uncultured Roseibium sp. TaxID=1936171 RepID=UPI00261CE904|nr:hypothetical protein [uncultured Roseibium sp.]